MTTRYFVDEGGRSVKVIVGNAPPPDGMVEVPSLPPGPNYRWDVDTSTWVAVPVVPVVTSDDLALAFTPEQGEVLISDPKILNMMFRLKARGGVPANDQTLAEVIAYVKASQLLGPDTADQIDAALAPLLGQS